MTNSGIPGYRETDAGWIPEDWAPLSLGTIASARKSKAVAQQGVRCVELEHIEPETGRLLGWDSSGAQASIKTAFKQGDVLFGKLRPYLRKYAVAPFDGICTTEILAIHPKDDLADGSFLFQLMQGDGVFSTVEALSYGTKMPRVSWSDLANIVVGVPSLAEQRGVAAVLTAVDDKLDVIARQIEATQTLKQGLMQTLFSRGVGTQDADGRWVPHADFKDSELGKLPAGWEVAPLGELLEKLMDFRGRTPKKLGMDWGGGTIPALSANNVRAGYIDFDRECYLGSEELYAAWMVQGDTQKDDLVFTMEAPLGNVAVIPDDRKYILSQRVVLIRTNKRVNHSFLFQYLRSDTFGKILDSNATGTTAKGIQQKRLVQLPVVVPSLEEQAHIANVLDAIDSKLSALAAGRTKHEQQADCLGPWSARMSQAPEKTGVETPALDWLVRLGYTHLPGAAVKVEHRHLAPVLEDVLGPRLLALNPWLAEAPGGVDAALIELRKRANDELLAANQAVWQQVLHRSDIQVKDLAGQPRSVRFLDATDASRNDFHVVDQYVGRNADGELFRPDLLLFVNGLPLAIIECKASHHRLDEALAQLDGYQRSFAAQFVFNQVCVGLNRRQGLYGAILTKPGCYARYRLEATELAEVAALLGSEPAEQEQLLWALFEPGRFLELVTHFVLFETRDGKTVKKLPRYQQWRAVRKTVRRLTGATPLGGVIWHTQGSGKSLTMALLARLLRADSTGLANPTVLVLTDRRDLDKQIFDTFHAVGVRAIQAVSVAGLVRMLGNDYGSVFTSTVQKFQEGDEPVAQAEDLSGGEPEEADEVLQATRHRRVRVGKDFFMVEERNEHFGQHDADGVLLEAKWVELKREKISFRVLSAKPNFYVLVDEAHRSQYDFLAAFMRASLPNAKFIAFTGTPLLNDDKHTLAEFGGENRVSTSAGSCSTQMRFAA